MMKWLMATGVMLVLAPGASAQHGGAQHGGYAQMTAREIKALSDEQIGDLRAGRGMGLSLPAELNSYPGPLHALELQAALGLSSAQVARISAIRDRMSERAKQLGAEIIAAERELDRSFATASATPAGVAALLEDIARLGGQLRAVHILAHMETRALLSPDQTARYDAERGYRSAGPVPAKGSHRHRH